MTAPLLSVSNLTVAFGGKAVVRGIDFSLSAGEKLALVGESGSGKTVTALSLLRLLPDAQLGGQALLDGDDLLTMSERALRGIRGSQIAMIFQEPMTALNPVYTVGEQIAEVLELKQGQSPAEARRLFAAIKERTGPSSPVWKRIKELEKTYE